MALVKCPICEKKFDREKEPYYIIGKRYAHGGGTCEAIAKEREAQRLEDEVERTKETYHRKELIDYIMLLQETDRPHGLALKNMKDFREQGYTYQGMKSTLYYFHEIKENPVLGTGIGIIPYVYEEAIDFFTRKVKSNKSYETLLEKGQEVVTKRAEPIIIQTQFDRGKKTREIYDIEELE